jgi:hypothetical protein
MKIFASIAQKYAPKNQSHKLLMDYIEPFNNGLILNTGLYTYANRIENLLKTINRENKRCKPLTLRKSEITKDSQIWLISDERNQLVIIRMQIVLKTWS